MINLFVTYIFTDRKDRDSFYKEISEAGTGALSRQEEGCLKYEYYFPAEDDTRLFLWEQWDSEEALERHNNMPHFINLRSIKEKYEVTTDILRK